MPHKIAVGLLLLFFVTWQSIRSAHGVPYEILVDSDIDTDDFFALLYLLKQNRSEFNLKGITINANTWSDAGHAVNHVYDILYMMGRDDIPVGIGGEGGILYNGTILPNVGGYLPLIEQGLSTMGGCRYRQSIPPGPGGRLDIDTNYGVRRELLPQGKRRYLPLVQPTAQEVMVKALSSGPTIVLLIGAHTNFALFLMTHPHLKKNVEHIYIMGGGVRSRNPKGCCAVNASASCTPTQCGDRGNIFTGYHSDPFAEFNIFGDPFAAYQVFHSGIPITLVPLDATNTILISKEFFTAFERNRKTYEAQYIFESLKLVRDTWYDHLFYTSYFMWDSFMSGVTISSIRNGHLNSDANEFAELKYINVTVVTSNKPYGIRDYSNPFFDDRKVPKFNLKKGGVHSGHVITDLEDPSCFFPMGNGKCQDGYTKEVAGSEGVQILVATKAKANPDRKSRLNRAFYIDFLKVLNSPFQTAKFNLRTEFPYYKEVHYLPNFGGKKRGTPIIFDMDISPGDIITLFYLLKMPIELIDLKAITVNGNGWTNAATIDIIYDILHMMGRDDIAVGLGDFFALNQSYSFSSAVGNCKYSKAIPYGSGGLIDTDTLFGLARDLPRSPRRYTAHDSVKFGAIRNTEHPELRQPKAIEIWQNISSNLESGSKVTILAAGPLTNIAKMVNSTTSSKIEHIYIVGGTAEGTEQGKGKGNGNVFSVKVNKGAELNFFLDPLAASQVIEQAHAKFNVTVVPLSVQRNVSSLRALRTALIKSKFSKNETSSSSSTGEAAFVLRLVSKMLRLSAKRQFYRHLDMFVGEVIGGAVIMQEQRRSVGAETHAAASWPWPWPSVSATGHVATDGIDNINIGNGNANGSCIFSSSSPCCCLQVVTNIHPSAFYHDIAFWLHKRSNQSALIPDFSAQVKLWNTPPAPAPAPDN